MLYYINTIFLGSLSNRNEFMTDFLYKKYGPIVRFDGNFAAPPMIILYDAEATSKVSNEYIIILSQYFFLTHYVMNA